MDGSPRIVTNRLLQLILVGSLALSLLAGCASLAPQEEPPLARVTADELIALLYQRDAAVHSMKALFTAKVRGGLIPILSRVEGTVHYRRPNALRLRGFTPIGGELFEFVQADEWYKLRLPLEGKVYTGRQSDLKDLGKLARFSQLSAWAIGGVLGTSSVAKDESVKLVEEHARYRLDVYGAASAGDYSTRSPIRRLWFDRRLLVVQEDRLGLGGDVEATIYYDDFRPVDNVGLAQAQAMIESDVRALRPFKVSLEDGRGPGVVQVIFHEMHQNQTISAEDLGQIS